MPSHRHRNIEAKAYVIKEKEEEDGYALRSKND